MAVIAYWPLDDAPGSTRAVSAVGGPPLLARVNVGAGITPTAEFSPFAWDSGTLHQWLPPCLRAESGGDLQGGKLIAGRMARLGVAGEWALDFLYQATAPAGNEDDRALNSHHFLRQTDGIEWILTFTPRTGLASVTAFDSDGNLLGGNASIDTGSVHDGLVKFVRLAITDATGGVARWRLSIDTLQFGTGTVSIGGIPQAPNRYEAFWDQDSIQSPPSVLPFHIGQIVVWDVTPLPVLSEVGAVILGHQGETPLQRIRRVCLEDAVPFAGFGSPAVHEHATLLGPQQTDTFLGLLRDAERTSAGGVLHELAGGLAYATVEQRYNQTPMELSGAAGDLAEPPEPTDDDQQLVNQVTVTKAITGEVARVENADSIAESGVQPLDVEANTASEAQLGPIASWLLGVGLGSRDEYRWPELPLNLLLTPDLIPAWLDFRVGGRVTLDDVADQLPGVTVDVLAEGWSESLHQVSPDEVNWQITLNTVPAAPFTVGVYAAEGTTPAPDAPSRYSPADSRTDAAFTSGTNTALTVEDQTGTDLWSQTADFPFDIRVAGVRLRVTAAGAPVGAVQVLTVDQAPVNGVAKVIPVGSTVELFTPGRYAL